MTCFSQSDVSRLEAGDVPEGLVLTPCTFAITVELS